MGMGIPVSIRINAKRIILFQQIYSLLLFIYIRLKDCLSFELGLNGCCQPCLSFCVDFSPFITQL